MKQCGVYKITSPDGKVYVGGSTNIEERWKQHKRASSRCQRKLVNSLKKYGSKNHRFETLELCDEKDLTEREVFYGLHYDVLAKDKGLNLALPKNKKGEGGFSEEANLKGGFYGFKKGHSTWNKGKECSLETRLKISDSKKGSKPWNKGKKIKDSNPSYQNHNSKIVLCLSSGVFYNSASEAAKYNNLKRTTLQAMLAGVNKNKTNLKYV